MEKPRLWTPPLRRLTPKTTRGFEAIAFAEDVLHMTLHPYQKWLFIHALELLPDGRYRFGTIIILIARQNGKTTWKQVKALWRMFMDGANLVIGTAQNLDVAEETWTGAVEMAMSEPDLAREIEHVDRTNGKKALRLASGQRYKVAAASRRGGRGLSGDEVDLDELREHQTWDAWAAVTKTTMARPNPQITCTSNAGDSQSVVLKHLRSQALAAIAAPGLDDSIGLFEWSAPDGCDMDDPQGWAQANPSLGYTGGITEKGIRNALGTDPEAVFRTEVLCQWVDVMTDPIFGYGTWDAIADDDVETGQASTFGVDVTPDRGYATIGFASQLGERIFVGVAFHAPGTNWVVDACREIQASRGDVTFTLDPVGPAGSLVPDFEAAGIELTKFTTQDAKKACGSFYDAVKEKRIVHRTDVDLDIAVAAAKKREVGDAWLYDRKRSAIICPLVAVTWAAWALHDALPADYDPLASLGANVRGA